LFGNIRDEIKQEILGVLLVAVTILIYVGLFSPSSSGAGQAVRLALTAAFGSRAQAVMPAAVGLAGLLCIFKKGHLLAGARAVGWILGLVVILGWLHSLAPGVAGDEFQNATRGVGGGVIGAAVTWALREVAGPIGRDVALVALSLVAFLLATDLSLVVLFGSLFAGLAAFGRWSWRTLTKFVGRLGRDQRPRRRPVSGEYEPRGYGSHERVSLPPGRSASIRRAGQPVDLAGHGIVGLGRVTEAGAVGGGQGPRPPIGRAAETIESRDSGRGLAGAMAAGAAGTGGPGAGAAGAVARTAAGTVAGQSREQAAGAAAAGIRAGGGRRKPYEQITLTEDYLYELPPISILDPPSPTKGRRIKQDLDEKARLLEETLASFGVGGKVVDVRRGPVVTRFEFQPAPGVKVARITSLADDIALHLAAQGVRIEAPIPGKHAVGIEVPNLETSTVPLREVLEDPEVAKQLSKLTVVFGKEITGRPITGDLDRLLHVLIAGTTGSGKSVCINAILASLLFRAKPNEVKLLLIDPKVVELSVYEGIPHLVAPVVTDPRKAAGCLRWAVKQMEERYELFAAAGVRDITRYNALVAEARAGSADRPPRAGASAPPPWAAFSGQVAAAAVGASPGPAQTPTVTAAGTAVGSLEAETARQTRAGAGPQPLPYIVIVIDELADLMMVAPVDVEDAIWRLAQMARAAGIHLVVATQRPSVDVVTGTIKANIPTRVAFAVASQVDSRTIIDGPGAEKLLGHGDMLFMPVGQTKPIRVQGAYVSDQEIESLVAYVKSQGRPRYAPDVLQTEETGGKGAEQADDSLFEDAVRVVMETGQASISMIQRKLRVGYTRAGRLIDMMEEKGIVGPFEGSKAREIMMTFDQHRRQKEAAKRAMEPPGREGPQSPTVTLGPGGSRRPPRGEEGDLGEE
jgi:S-DNA-T family DNA segregation ATPase FtsK/SpoIIIE